MTSSVAKLATVLVLGGCASTIHVPEDYSDLMMAASKASSGSTIILGPGRFALRNVIENVSIRGAGSDSTVIVFHKGGSVRLRGWQRTSIQDVAMEASDDADNEFMCPIQVDGGYLSLQNVRLSNLPHGVCVKRAGLVIDSATFERCQRTAVSADDADVRIRRSRFVDNFFAVGISGKASALMVEDSVFDENFVPLQVDTFARAEVVRSTFSQSLVSAIAASEGADVQAVQSRFDDNARVCQTTPGSRAAFTDAVIVRSQISAFETAPGSSLHVRHSTIAFNKAEFGASLTVAPGAAAPDITFEDSVVAADLSGASVERVEGFKALARQFSVGPAPRPNAETIFAARTASGAWEWLLADGTTKAIDPPFVDPDHGDFRVRNDGPFERHYRPFGNRTYGAREPGSTALARNVGAKSLPEVLVAGAAPQSGRKRAVLVGVDHYHKDPGIPELHYAGDDVTAVAEWLRANKYEVRILTDKSVPPATRGNVEKALIWLATLSPGDSGIFYFSGHGSNEPDELGSAAGFLLLPESEEKALSATALSLERVRTALAHPQNPRLVAIYLDACFAGNAVDAKGIGSLQPGSKGGMDSLTTRLVAGKGRIGLFSSRNNEPSFECKEHGHGCFTYQLLEAWKHQKVGIDDVYRHISENLKRQHPLIQQNAEGDVPTY